MAVVTVAGPPSRAPEARVGFPYILPLSTAPPPEWAQEFEAQDWGAIDQRLRPPRHPRLDGDRVWLPGLDLAAMTEVLDHVVARIEKIDRDYEADADAREKRRSEAMREAADRRAQEDAVFGEWASSRPKRPTEP